MSGPLIPAAWTRPAGIAAASTLWLSGNVGAGAIGGFAPAPERHCCGDQRSRFSNNLSRNRSDPFEAAGCGFSGSFSRRHDPES